MTSTAEPIQPTPYIAARNRAAVASAPSPNSDFEDTSRGLIAVPDVSVIVSRTDPAKVVWDFTAYEFLSDTEWNQAPPTANPLLWRQGQLAAQAGLFQVISAGGRTIYQVRGYDLSNMTILNGDTGLIVIDPLACYETAQAALALYRKTTGDRSPISTLIYTHSHVDHFGGSRGLFAELGDQVPATLKVYAPTGFLEHAISENVYAGPAMARRAEYMYAAALDKGPGGQIGTGLGQTVSTGEVTLIAPTDTIGDGPATPQREWTSGYVIPWRQGLYARAVDGVPMIFQLTPGTEAPAEMNFYFPEPRALCMAENATHNLHNILSIRGAQVRDAHVWSTYLTEAIQAFAPYSDVEFASHHWPHWVSENIVGFLSNQRDMYGYLNDQTLRMIDAGYTGIEIAEKLQALPPNLAAQWYTQGYYGSLSHNFKAVYQRYMGWYDGNPANLWKLPPTPAAVNYLRAMGGAATVVELAQQAYDTNDYRWAAELLNHVVFAAGDAGAPVPADVLTQAKALQAQTLTQLGYGAENGTWRNAYLTGAWELQMGHAQRPTSTGASDLVRSMDLSLFFAAMAKSIDGPTAGARQLAPIVLRWNVTDDPAQGGGTDVGTTVLRNGVLVYADGTYELAGEPAATITMTRDTFNGLVLAGMDFKANFDAAVNKGDSGIQITGDPTAPDTVFGYLTFPDPVFPLVTPRPDPAHN
ncbi:alkyl/aryl-sulfatase [Kitasatospora sp. NPDC089509]|uniref:alkyl/aryl-sulfatase n=1 Tax=Kitasatospora sp. NPDC089509 TaxID=3364079 RepID=UPI0037FC7BF2